MSRNKKPAAQDDARVAPLLALQRELRLTAKQCRFAEALSKDPKRNGTKAAIAAGASRKSAHIQASKWLRLAKVQRYLAALSVEATEKRGEDTRAAVAGLAEVLTTLTAQMRVRAGDYLLPSGKVDKRAVRVAAPGLITGELTKLKLADSQNAAKLLLAHFMEKPLGGAGGNITVNTVINSLPDELVVALWRGHGVGVGAATPDPDQS